MDLPERFAIRARWVFPVEMPPIPGGVVTVDRGRLVAVGNEPQGADLIDLGNVAVLPGLVNAHTHLEFSGLPEPLGSPGLGFADWIREVIRYRQGRTLQAAAAEEAVRAGLRQSLALGTTTLGEIATADEHRAAYTAPPGGVVFRELLSTDPRQIEPLLATADAHRAAFAGDRSPWGGGVSPHAPFTTRIELVQRAAEWARRARVPLAMHLAESRDELRLLARHDGPLVDLLHQQDAWDPTAIPRGTTIAEYLDLLSHAGRTLIVHGNYLTGDDIARLAAARNRMSVVYCPRTHAFFGHDTYPLAALLDAGVNVALGTDSRASSPDLSLLSEMRHVAATFEEVPRSTIVRMGILGGAQALGCGDRIGSLAAGKRADLTVVALPDRDAADPHELLLVDGEPVSAVLCAGKWIA